MQFTGKKLNRLEVRNYIANLSGLSLTNKIRQWRSHIVMAE